MDGNENIYDYGRGGFFTIPDTNINFGNENIDDYRSEGFFTIPDTNINF
jgi:hypothetical protein